MANKVSGERGATLLEFAIVAPVLLFLLLVTVQMLHLCFVSLTLQFAAGRAMRVAVIGPDQESEPKQTLVQHTSAVSDMVLKLANSLGVKLKSDEVTICASSGAASTSCTKGSKDVGKAGWYLFIQLEHDVPVMFFKKYHVQVGSVGINEPWS